MKENGPDRVIEKSTDRKLMHNESIDSINQDPIIISTGPEEGLYTMVSWTKLIITLLVTYICYTIVGITS